MNALKSILRDTPIEPLFKNLRYEWRNLSYNYGQAGRKHRQSFQSYQNKHRGKRAFLLGNGPSLKDTDLSLLKDEITFGMNRIYLLYDQTDFRPTYHAIVNPNVIEQFIDDIIPLNGSKFMPWMYRQWIPDDPSITLFPIQKSYPFGFAKDPRDGISEGMTVTYVCMQLAYFMGIETVYLIGVDHSFTTKGDPHKLVTSEGDDPNHFHPEYFGKGVKWQLPDLEGSEIAYAHARTVFEADGRNIYDATIGGKLQIFPKVDYASLFD